MYLHTLHGGFRVPARTHTHTFYTCAYTCIRRDRAPQVSLGPHWHNTFTDVTLHSKLLRCRTRIFFPPSHLPAAPSPAPSTPPGERDTVYTRVFNRDATRSRAHVHAHTRHLPNLYYSEGSPVSCFSLLVLTLSYFSGGRAILPSTRAEAPAL